MREPIDVLLMYLELAQISRKRQRSFIAARFLVLGSEMASQLQLSLISRFCQHLVLELNPRHIIGQWDVTQPWVMEEQLTLLRQLKRRYPLERAEQMLDQMNVVVTSVSHVYDSQEEAAASIFGLTPQQIEAVLSK